jgi:transcriptional regulator GlxA family with amidase domain
LARACGLPARSFGRAFTRATGLPPYRWLLQQRVNKAKDLLANSKLPLTEIAAACGFATAAHFVRVFTRQAGAAPDARRGYRCQ